MAAKTSGLKELMALLLVIASGCRAIVGTVAIATVAVVGVVGLVGYTAYKGGEAVVSGAEVAGKSVKNAVTFSNATFKTKSGHSLSVFYPAAETVLRRAGFVGVVGRQDALAGSVSAKTLSGEDVTVELKLIDKDRTSVAIQVGRGDLRQSEYLYDEMLRLLAERKEEG
jgi:hypothetical protein